MKQRKSLINLRKNRKLTQKEVVNELEQLYGIKITVSYYGMIEQGVRTPSLELAIAIAGLFNTNVEDIFFEQSPNKMLLDVQEVSGVSWVKIGDKNYTAIIITKQSVGDLVTKDTNQEVIAIISDDEKIVVKNGYEVKMIPAPNND